MGLLLTGGATSVLAGGWDNGIVGLRAPGMGTAFTGLADDPSAIFYNPAGISLLEQRQGMSGSIRYNATYLRYRPLSEGEGRQGRSFMMGIIPDFFYYRQLRTKAGKVSVGFGLYVPYGGEAGTWSPEVFGVDMNQFMAIGSLTPSVSWAITPRLALGVGFNLYIGFMKSRQIFDQIPVGLFLPNPPIDYVPLRLDQKFYVKGFPLGYNVGVLYRPHKKLSFGVAMRSGSHATLKGSSNTIVYLADPLALYVHSDLTIKFRLPYLVTAGVAYRPSSNLVFVGDIQYNGWGRLKGLELTFKQLGISQVSATGYKDTVKFMLGAEYTFLAHYSVRVGYMYTPSNIGDKRALSYQSWDTDVHNVSCGFGYTWDSFSIYGVAVISPGEWDRKGFSDPGDPVGKPAGKYTIFNQTYGLGCVWYF